jgi:glycosidase
MLNLRRVAAFLSLTCAAISSSARPQDDPGQPDTPPKPAAFTPSAYDAADDIFYQIMPIAWRHGQLSALPDLARDNRFGNFQGMTDSIPYLKSLGITGVWMTPIFPSPAYHGYQHGPADRVNPWFGDEAEFWTFVREAKAAGIKVYLDFVVYGINQDSPQYKAAREDPTGAALSLFAFENPGRTKPFGYSFKTWNGDTVRFVHWDLRNEASRRQVIRWCKHWLDPNDDGDPSDGVAGFRLDHVWSVYTPDRRTAPGGWGYNIDPFWLEWKRELSALKPDLFTFAEQAKWETWGTDLLPAHDATFTKPFEFAARRALKAEKAADLYEWMAKACEAAPKGRTFLTILGDHDVDRIASDVGADAPSAAGRAKAAAAILMLQPFPPVLYYGDEIGMLGKAGGYNSDSNDIPRREPMKWLATDATPMTRYHALDPRTVEGQFSKDKDGRSVEEQVAKPGSLLETYRELIKLRRDNVALRRGSYEPLACSNPSVWRFRRTHRDQSLEVAINLSGSEAAATATELPTPIPAYGYVVTAVP